MPKARISKAIVDRLKELHEKYIRELKDQDLEAIYTHLEGPYMDTVPAYNTPEHAEAMNRIIRGAPRIPEDITVYRGSSERYMLPENRYPLTTTFEEGSADAYAEGWEDVVGAENPALLAEIEVPRGSPGLTFREETFEDIFGRAMPFGDEAELLLPQQTGSELQKLRMLQRRLEKIGEREYEMLEGRYRYRPPYKARGGLINGNA